MVYMSEGLTLHKCVECERLTEELKELRSKLKKDCPDCDKPLNYTIQWHKHEHLKGGE